MCIELLDKGISVSTFDEFCLGKEDKLLHEMTQRTLDMMSKAGKVFMYVSAVIQYQKNIYTQWHLTLGKITF